MSKKLNTNNRAKQRKRSTRDNPIDIFLNRNGYYRSDLCSKYGIYPSTMSEIVKKDVNTINVRYIESLSKLTKINSGEVLNELLIIQNQLKDDRKTKDDK